MTYRVILEGEARENFLQLDKSIRLRIARKLVQLERKDLPARHMKHGLSFFVAEVSGYRIAFRVNEENKSKDLEFVGDHKAYQKWYSSLRA